MTEEQERRIAELEQRVHELENAGKPALCPECREMITSASWFRGEPFITYKNCMHGHTWRVTGNNWYRLNAELAHGTGEHYLEAI